MHPEDHSVEAGSEPRPFSWVLIEQVPARSCYITSSTIRISIQEGISPQILHYCKSFPIEEDVKFLLAVTHEPVTKEPE